MFFQMLAFHHLPFAKSQRLSIQHDTSQFRSSYTFDPLGTRSLLFFGSNKHFDTEKWKWVMGFKVS